MAFVQRGITAFCKSHGWAMHVETRRGETECGYCVSDEYKRLHAIQQKRQALLPKKPAKSAYQYDPHHLPTAVLAQLEAQFSDW